jgi:hypothetical protein
MGEFERYKGQAGIGAGVTRTFIQGVIQNIRNDGFFILADEESGRYVLNPDVTVEFLKAKGYNVKDEDAIDDIYRLIGRFFAFCIRNDVPVDMYLSRAVLSRLVFKESEIEPDEDVMYYLMDMKQIATSMINLMRDAQNIEAIGINFNDEFPLVKAKEDVVVTADNFKDYLRLRARHQMTRQIAEGKQDTSRRLKALVDGFYIRNKLRRNHATIKHIEKLLNGLSITEESIRTWLKGNHMDIRYSDDREAQVGTWFREILRDEGRTFPLGEFDKSASTTTLAERKKLFVEFFTNLMYFWCGLRKLDTRRTYEVTFIENPIPKAATCFYQLKLPKNVPSKEELYRKLVSAVFNVEAGVGLYGGKTRKNPPRRQTKTKS